MGELTGTERRVLAAAAAGEELDLRVGDAARDDPQGGADWDEARTVRAEFLSDLCIGLHDEWRVHARGLRLCGVRISGELNLEAATVGFPLTFRDCSFDQPLVLSQARLVTLRLPGCHLLGITADQLETRGNVALNDGFHATGEVRLPGAHIGGQLDCTNSTFTNPNGFALSCDGLTVDQNMFCRNGFHATGEVRLLSAHIGGQLDCTNSTFTNPNHTALNANRLTVNQSMYLRNGFRATGEVNLLSAHIGGQLACDGGTFTNPNGIALNADKLTVNQNMHLRNGFHATGEVNLFGAHIGGQLACDGGTFTNPNGIALNGQQMTVAGPLFLRPEAAPEGTVDLRHTRVGVLVDSRETWPTALRLDGLAYSAIKAVPEVGVEQRLGWLERDPHGYSPQPYEQLAAAYRRAGHEQEARAVAVAKQRARRRTLPRPARVWSRLLAVTVGYGYQPWRALWWLAGFVAVGAVLFTNAYPQAMTLVDPAKQPPMFQPVVYALDVLLPIVDLRQQDFWTPDATRPWGRAALGWFWLSIAAGWALATAVAAAVTGLLKTD